MFKNPFQKRFGIGVKLVSLDIDVSAHKLSCSFMQSAVREALCNAGKELRHFAAVARAEADKDLQDLGQESHRFGWVLQLAEQDAYFQGQARDRLGLRV